MMDPGHISSGSKSMQTRVLFGVLACVGTSLVSCQTGTLDVAAPFTACLTVNDVINIPPGNAVGSVIWGTYQAKSKLRQTCVQCNSNTVPEATCTGDFVDSSVRTVYIQEDGVLTAEDSAGETVTGAINDDGSFRIGSIIPLTNSNGIQTGQGLVLIEGSFTGDHIVATMTMRLTANGDDGVYDLQATSTVTWERVD